MEVFKIKKLKSFFKKHGPLTLSFFEFSVAMIMFKKAFGDFPLWKYVVLLFVVVTSVIVYDALEPYSVRILGKLKKSRGANNV